MARVMNVFISSPGDLFPERDALEEVIDEMNGRAVFVNRVKLVPQKYEDTAPAVVGMEPQVVVERYLVPPETVDIFVCMLWLRMGTPQNIVDPKTHEGYRSGTEYEFLKAYEAFGRTGRPTILLYRCLRPQPAKLPYAIQPELVEQFFARFDVERGSLKGMIRTFTDAEELKAVFRNDLDRILTHSLRFRPSHSLGWWLRAHARLALAMLAAVVVVALIASGVFYARRPVPVPSLALADADVGGWLFVRQKSSAGPNVLEVMDPRTAALRPLWPSVQELEHPTISAQYTDYYAPFYSPATHRLAFTAVSQSGVRSVWIATIAFGPDGWPAVEGQPAHLIDLCGPCSEEVAWSPSGRWLIYQGADGLYAVSPQTQAQQRLSSYAQDAWPACSPDGHWLAYQGSHHGIQVLPSADCLPVAGASSHARFVNGVAFGWHPRWSLDGKQLIFSSNVSNGWTLYEVNFADLAPAYDPNQSTPYTLAGAPGCGSLTWAQRQRSRQELIVFACKLAHPNPGTFGCSLLISPAANPASWKTTVSAGSHLWDDVEWVAPAAA